MSTTFEIKGIFFINKKIKLTEQKEQKLTKNCGIQIEIDTKIQLKN